jgi:hypothetical protein
VLAGAAGADLAGHLEIGGASGGTVELSSAAGSVRMGIDVRGKASVGDGATLIVSAADTVTIERGLRADGGIDGGEITVSGAAVVIANILSAKGKRGRGGRILVQGTSVVVDGNLRVKGATRGGDVVVLAGGALVDTRLDVRGDQGGTVLMRASAGDLTVARAFKANPGGAIQLEAPAGTLGVTGRVATGGTGCIGLAGAVVDLTLAKLDTPPSGTCGLVP